MAGELADALKKLNPPERGWVVGTVAAVDERAFTCDVLPEDGGQLLKGVSLRLTVAAADSAAGLFGIPQVQSPCLVAHADGRHKLLYAQKLTKVYAVTAAGFGLAVDGVSDRITLGGRTAATHAAVLGDELWDYLKALESWLAAHTHGNPATTGGVTTPAFGGAPQPTMPTAMLSAKVRLE